MTMQRMDILHAHLNTYGQVDEHVQIGGLPAKEINGGTDERIDGGIKGIKIQDNF